MAKFFVLSAHQGLVEMLVNRLSYIAVLLAAACFYVLYPFWIAWYLLALVVFLVFFDLLFSIPGMVTTRLSIAAPRVLERGEEAKLSIYSLQGKRYPSGYVKGKLLETNDEITYKHRIRCSSDTTGRYDIAIDTSHCGASVFELGRIFNTSLLGLFSMSHKLNCYAAVVVLPDSMKPPNIIPLPRGVVLRPKPGGGFSEDSELRAYRSGDLVKTIHWKLSAKLDSLIVREALEPPPHSRLVLVSRWADSKERDIVLGRFRWISEYLLKWGLPFCVRFGDSGAFAEIADRGDFISYLYQIMIGKAHEVKPPVQLPARFTWVFRVDGITEDSQ